MGVNGETQQRVTATGFEWDSYGIKYAVKHFNDGTSERTQIATDGEKAQAFFENMANEAKKPHFGDHMREWTRALLLRAEEAALYDPRKAP